MQRETFKKKVVRYPLEPGKDVKIKMKPIFVDTSKLTLICESCSYRNICTEFRDPTNPDNPELYLCDFCQKLSIVDKKDDLEEDNDILLGEGELVTYIPSPGAFEEAFPECFDDLSCLLNSKKRFDITEVIEKICPEWCSFYNKEHSNCNGSNQICILNKLFDGSKE